MQGINPYWIVVVSLVISALPMLFAMASCYLKVNIVIGLLRSGLGAQQVPGNLVIMSLSLALTLYVMSPVIQQSIQASETIDLKQFEKNPSVSNIKKLYPLLSPWLDFMRKHASEREIAALLQLEKLRGEPGNIDAGNSESKTNSDQTAPDRVDTPSPNVLSKDLDSGTATADSKGSLYSKDSLGFGMLSLAFLLTELRQAFSMGFVLLLPFLVIDLIVANVLVGMGMNMVSPVMISLPLKLILLVMTDGWLLISRGLIVSYGI